MIGGLIASRHFTRKRQVPFFGDLPLVGPLFRSESDDRTETEFLIVVTPYVIQSPAEIDLLTDREIDRLSLPAEVKEQLRRSMLKSRLYDPTVDEIRNVGDEGRE